MLILFHCSGLLVWHFSAGSLRLIEEAVLCIGEHRANTYTATSSAQTKHKVIGKPLFTHQCISLERAVLKPLGDPFLHAWSFYVIFKINIGSRYTGCKGKGEAGGTDLDRPDLFFFFFLDFTSGEPKQTPVSTYWQYRILQPLLRLERMQWAE